MRTELELRHLRVFVAVVEAGAHTRAARSLGLSQSTVSETLSALERALGTPLFRKAGPGPRLTPSGEALLPYARRLIAVASEALTELARVSSQVSGTLVVAAVESLCAYVLPDRLAALRERWPRARLEVVTGACPDIRASVAAGRCDLGLVLEADRGGPGDPVLAHGRLVIFGARAHPLAGRAATPGELARADLSLSDAAGDYHQILRRYFEAAQVAPPRTQALGTIEGVKRGVLAGGSALGLLPAHALAPELREGVLAEVLLHPPLPGLVMRAVLPSGTAPSPLVDDLVASLRGSLGSEAASA